MSLQHVAQPVKHIRSRAAARSLAATLNAHMTVGQHASLAGCSFVKSGEGQFQIARGGITFVTVFDIAGFGDLIIWMNRRAWSQAVLS